MAIDTSDSRSLGYAQVEVSGTSIRKIVNGKVVSAVKKEEIQQIRVGYDPETNNPFLRYFFGVTLFFLGLLGLAVSFFALAGGGMVSPKPGEFVIPVVPVVLWAMTGIGFWLLLGIFRARYNLSIETVDGVRRIFFAKEAKADEVRQFIRRVNHRYGYGIDFSILDKAPRPSA